MRRHSFAIFAAGCCLAVCAMGSVARAETFILGSGGRIDGTLLNPDESPRVKYLVALDSGAKLALAKGQVTRVLESTRAEAQYEVFLQKMPNDLEGHWKMAEWCVRNGLAPQREFHLREIIRLDPGHQKAHLALGYTNIDGRWVVPQQHNQQLGYVKFQGAWRTPQDVAIATQRQQIVDAETKWRVDIKMWRGWLTRPSKADEGMAKLQAIDDPLASPTLVEMVTDPKEPPNLRLVCVDILGRLANRSPLARGELTNRALYDTHVEIRERSLDYLEKLNQPRLIAANFAKALGDKNNVVVNRAAVGIARLKDEESIPQLIEALNTNHKFIVTTGSGNIGANFGGPNGGLGGLTAGGGGPKQESRDINNEQVQQALIALTGGQNFGFNKDAWRNWYAESKVPQDIDLRRRK